MHRNLLFCCGVLFLLAIATESSAVPATAPSTAPATAPSGPQVLIHTFLSALEHQDQKAARACWDVPDPQQAHAVDRQLNVLMALARLKNLVRDKLGPGSVLDIALAVGTDWECGAIDVKVDGNHATAQVHSIDPQSEMIHGGPTPYSLVKLNGRWKLTMADELKANPSPQASQQADMMAQVMTQAFNRTSDALAAGKLRSIEDVQRSISESLPE